MRRKSLGRLDFIVRQRKKILLRIFYLEGLGIWFKEASEIVKPISEEKAMRLVQAWQQNHENANARISGGLIPYLESDAYTTQSRMIEQLESNRKITIGVA